MAQNCPKWPKLGPHTSIHLSIMPFHETRKSLIVLFLGKQYHCTHEIHIFSIFKNMKKSVKGFFGLFSSISDHFGLVTDWIFEKGSQCNFTHEVKTFSVLKEKIRKCWGLILAILGHFGPFWAFYRCWIFLKGFLGHQYHFAHKVKTFSVLKYKNKRC